MKKDILNEPLFRERSYIKSLMEGSRLVLRHPLSFLRHLWPLMLIYVVLWAVVARWVAPHVWEFITMMSQSGVAPSALISMPLFYIMGWGLMAVVLLGVQSGQVVFLMLRYGTLTYIPVVHPWHVWRSILPHVGRGVAGYVSGYLVMCANVLLSLWLMPTRFWALVLFILLSLLWMMVHTSACQQFMLSRCKFLSSFLYAFRSRDVMTENTVVVHHSSRVGGNVAILVVCGMVVLLVIVAGLLPAVCAIYVGGISEQAVTIGDSTDLPSSFPLLRACCFGLGALVTFLSMPFLLVPLAFHWGAGEK